MGCPIIKKNSTVSVSSESLDVMNMLLSVGTRKLFWCRDWAPKGKGFYGTRHGFQWDVISSLLGLHKSDILWVRR